VAWIQYRFIDCASAHSDQVVQEHMVELVRKI